MTEQDDSRILRETSQGEQWLAGYETPGPSPQVMARVRQAARDGLRTDRRMFEWRAWHGTAAAAAVVLFSVTIGWYSSRGPAAPGIGIDPNGGMELPVSPVAAQYATRFATLDEELTELESARLGDGSLFQAWQDALEEFDTAAEAAGASS